MPDTPERKFETGGPTYQPREETPMAQTYSSIGLDYIEEHAEMIKSVAVAIGVRPEAIAGGGEDVLRFETLDPLDL